MAHRTLRQHESAPVANHFAFLAKRWSTVCRP